MPQAPAALAGPGRHQWGDSEPPAARPGSGALPRAEAVEGQGRPVERAAHLASEEGREGTAIDRLLCAERSPRLLI